MIDSALSIDTRDRQALHLLVIYIIELSSTFRVVPVRAFDSVQPRPLDTEEALAGGFEADEVALNKMSRPTCLSNNMLEGCLSLRESPVLLYIRQL